MIISQIKKDLAKLIEKEKVKNLSSFFKTGKGDYGEGDIFLGITVPNQRKVAKKYLNIELKDISNLINSKYHEERLTAIIILVEKYKKSNIDKEKKEIIDFYLKNLKYINNWDLVDISCPTIVGDYFLEKDKNILYKLVKSKNLWEKRISIISTLGFIRKGKFEDTIKISEILVNDEHDLIHKAVGWMLREVGKRNQKIEEDFLKKYYKIMPRTMLRYAIEKFDKQKKDFYMKK